jgi:hypothetical protein
MPISYTSRHVPDQAFVPPYILYRAAPRPPDLREAKSKKAVNPVKVYLCLLLMLRVSPHYIVRL